MNALVQLLFKAGPIRVIAGLGLAAIAAAALFTLAFRMGGEEKALLFANIELSEAGEIASRLDQAGIPYDLSPDGTAIFVPRSKVLNARMMLSADGLPSSGSVGYEIFDKADVLGATQFQQDINRLRALEGELARTIASLDGVRSARVHLVLPERRLFERDQQQPSASIVLDVRAALTPPQVRAVRNLVASAVPGLSPLRVTVLDGAGRLLAASAADGETATSEQADDARIAMEERIRKTVQDIVESVVGPGAARVQVAAEMDFNRITENSERFDPEGRVVRSTQTVEETSQSSEPGSRAATATNNVPDGAGGAADGSSEGSNRAEETVNYEISRTTRTEITEGGRVKRLSVAVAVDGRMAAPAPGEAAVWQPRDEAEIERITALVRSAVGFDEARGDKVEVVNIQFARAELPGEEAVAPSLLDFQSSDIMRALEILAALVAALALVFFVLRPLAGAVAKPSKPMALTAPGVAGAPAVASPAAITADAPASDSNSLVSADAMRIRGELRASSIKQVAEIVEQHPDESVAILRQWLSQAA